MKRWEERQTVLHPYEHESSDIWIPDVVVPVFFVSIRWVYLLVHVL